MKYVNTVTGPVNVENLGRTLMHEHFLFGFAGWQGDSTLGGWKEDEYTRACIQAALAAKAYGIQTVVDATTNECGRNVLFLKKISQMTGINIICSTGYYFQDESAYAYWKFRKNFSDIGQEIYEMMKTELTVGIEGTKIKAGVIKLASSKDCITPMEEIFFKAAARAQRETGCVIITHTQEGTLGPEQAKLLIQNGADPWKIAIGHMCGNLNISYHEAVLKTGVYDNIDRFGLEGELFHTPTDDERVNLVTQLIARGYCERLLLAHDSVTVNLGRPMNMGKEMKEAMEHANIGNIGKRIIPMLMKNGITSSQIDTMLKTNPSRLFC